MTTKIIVSALLALGLLNACAAESRTDVLAERLYMSTPLTPTDVLAERLYTSTPLTPTDVLAERLYMSTPLLPTDVLPERLYMSTPLLPTDVLPERLYTSSPTNTPLPTATLAPSRTRTPTRTPMPTPTSTVTASVEMNSILRGKERFHFYTCDSCHDTRQPFPGGFDAPNLGNISIEAERIIRLPEYQGRAKNAAEYIHESVLSPNVYIVSGELYLDAPGKSAMYQKFAQEMSPQDLDDITAYLLSLEANPAHNLKRGKELIE